MWDKPPPRTLPFRVVGHGVSICCPAPGHHDSRLYPGATVNRRGRFVYINVYAGTFPSLGYDISVQRATVVRAQGRLQFRIEATLTVPKLPTGDALQPPTPYEVIRIRRGAISGRVPTRAFLIETQNGFHPQSSFAQIRRIFVDRPGSDLLQGAVAVQRFDPLHVMTGGGPTSDTGPVWYVRGSGVFRWRSGLTSLTGYFVVDDHTRSVFLGGYP